MEKSSVPILLPKGLKHWINSIKTPSCTLLNDVSDLLDGRCICEIVENLFENPVTLKNESAKTAAGRIQCALNAVGDSIGWNKIPPEFKNRDCAVAISQGEATLTITLLQFLHSIHTQRLGGGNLHDFDTDVEDALYQRNAQQNSANSTESAHSPENETMMFGHQQGNQFTVDNDSLDAASEQELRVVEKARSHATQRSASRTGVSSRRIPTRSTTPPLVFTRRAAPPAAQPRAGTPTGQDRIAPTSGTKLSAEPTASEQTQKAAPTVAKKLVTRKVATHPGRSPTSAASKLTSGTTSSNNTSVKGQFLTAPAGVTVCAGQGLSLGSSMVDPSYKPGRRNRFAETLEPAPEPVSSSTESDSDDSIRPTYDYVFAGQPRGRESQRREIQAQINARMPHSRDISPVGRRHVHCQLRSVAGGPSVPPTSGGGHMNGPHDHLPASGSGAVKMRSQERSSSDAHASASRSEVRARQAAAVLGVFHGQKLPQRRGSTAPQAAGIDDVVSMEKKNAILEWMQRQLGVTPDTLLKSTTSHHYNTTAGKHLVLSDAIAVTQNAPSTADARTKSVKKRKKKHAPTENPDGSQRVHSDVDKENYHFYPVPEDVRYTPGRTANMPGSYSISSYLGRVTESMPAYTNNAAVQVAAQQWLLQISAEAAARPFDPKQDHKTPVTPVGYINDPWVNGVLLSEIVAAMFAENRALIKQVENYDRFGRLLSTPRLILTGTEHTVKSRAQAMHNLQLCMDVINSNVTGFPTLDYCAEDIIAGSVSLWKLLDTLYDTVRHNMRGTSAGRGRRRARSASPSSGLRIRPSRSVSAPPVPHAADPAPGGNRVSFSDSTHPEPRSRQSLPAPAAAPSRHQHVPVPAVQPPATGARSRSTSPGEQGAASRASAVKIDAGAVAQLELRRQEKEHERERARLYAQKKRQQALAANAAEANQLAPAAPREWVSTTTIERPRSGSAPPRTATAPPARKEPSAASNPTSAPANSAQEYGAAEPASAARTPSSKTWHPPKLTTVEVEAATSTPLPAVSMYQQRAIREWIAKTFQIRLLDAECGFHAHSESTTSSEPPTTDSATTDAKNAHSPKYDPKYDPRFDLLSQHAPPPLPLQDDRVRNGVLLGQLLVRLEPHAALHAHIPKLLHKHPRSLPASLENLERVLWVFKLRRSPPIPAHYLCQPEEILKGNPMVVWGLLWEIMQAYPYATLASVAASAQTSTGVMPATKEAVAPVASGLGGHRRQPLRSGLAHVFNHAADAAAERRKGALRRQSTAGMKGEEAKHNIPNNMRYNYADPGLENPVLAHTLPYSDRQRHQLDLSLLHWLGEKGIIADIVGSLAQPVTILALESYCRDGTLYCMVLENVLKLTLLKEWHRQPSSYIECMSNLKQCFDVLRKCQNMNARYLYAGVEEDICRGKWDSILGSLEDVHRFADNVHPHAQIFSTVDVHGNVIKPKDVRAGFNYDTVQAPYLGSNPQYVASLEAAEYTPAGEDDAEAPGGTRARPSGPGARTTAVAGLGSDLLHDVPYAFAPLLDIAPPATSTQPSSKPRTVTPGLEQQLRRSPSSNSPLPADFFGRQGGAGGVDLFPSNAVSGENVTNILSKQAESGPPLHPSSRPVPRSRIPTPVKPRSPTGSPLSPILPVPTQQDTASARGSSSASHWFQDSATQPSTPGGGKPADHRQLSQALGFTDSETEALHAPSQLHDSLDRSRRGAGSHGSPARSRSVSPSRASPALTPASAKRFHLYNRRGVNTTAISEFDSDSLDESPPTPDSIEAAAAAASASPADMHKARKIIKWFGQLNMKLAHKNGNFARHTFGDGVLLCMLLQKLERCGPLAGTFPHPRTQGERVQNIRRCLELLATRHKSIPLRSLSCEEEVLDGNISATLDLLLCIRRAYATHRL